MCGIVGYIGEERAWPFLLEGLKRLEYRGYDSAGVAVLEDEGPVLLEKAAGRISALEEALSNEEPAGRVGIGHTRWATHGEPNRVNAHPHPDCTGDFIVAHNGIIENFLELREELLQRGHRFRSETDSEVVAHLLEDSYRRDLLEAVREAVSRLRGSYALAILSRREPDLVVGVRRDSPLVVGLGEGENFLASDIPAILSRTRRTVILEDGEIVALRRDGIKVYDQNLRPLVKEVFQVTWDAAAAEKGGHPHFMLKEIYEQPKAFRDTMAGRIRADGSGVNLPELDKVDLNSFQKIDIVACGTAYHAGLIGKRLIESLAGLPVEVDFGSEYRYRSPMVSSRTLLLLISQSGETADTLAALREGRSRGATTLAITNVVGSSIDREAEMVLHTWAGPEIAVASTKAYTTQILVLTLLAVHLGLGRGTLPSKKAAELLTEMQDLPRKAEATLAQEKVVRRLAAEIASRPDVFFIGRGLDYAVAQEAQLKLKEISYLHAEALPAGELKHGTLALIEEGVPVISLLTQREVEEKTLSNIAEVKARAAQVIALAQAGDPAGARFENLLTIPDTPSLLTPALAILPLQLLAYHTAVLRGADVDKPRNLAKSVTVE